MSLNETARPAPRPLGPLHYPDVSQDAVVVIPGIMGSTLVDTVTGDTLWGLDRLGWYRQAWTSGESLRALGNREPGRIVARGLLRFPAWAPLGNFEPYTTLIRGLHTMVAHPDAVLEFGYDWRLPVLDNARLLARAAHAHLTAWRAHPTHDHARRISPDERPAQLVLVAHSMGGLLARALPLVEGTNDSHGDVPAPPLTSGPPSPWAHRSRARRKSRSSSGPGGGCRCPHAG